jgi:hypothetical protein
MVEMVRRQLQETGEDPALLSVQTEATISRWSMQEATILAYHDIFFFTSVVVLLTVVPVLWLRQQRVPA